MIFKFSPVPPPDYSKEIPIISGSESLDLLFQEYLIVEEHDIVRNVYEIRFDYRCSPFKEVFILENRLAVGLEGYFYLFDLDLAICKLRLEVQGYFSHIYYDNSLIFVCDSAGIYCFNLEGNLQWKNKRLAIDGVFIEKIDEGYIYGSGEWDPPGGWKDFILDKNSGLAI